MSAFPPERNALVARCQQDRLSAADRGAALEELIAITFAAVPGVSVRARNARSVFENEELDLVMSNLALPDGLPTAGPHLSVECKNWSQPVGSMELAWFATKLRRSGQGFGVLVAARGVTGSASGLTAAHFEAATALGEGQVVVVLTLAELSWLADGEQLAKLLGEKHGCLVARREIKIYDHPPEHLSLTLRPAARPSSHNEREALIAALASGVDRAEDLRSVDVTLEQLWPVVEAFFDLDEQEPSISDGGEESFERWSERDLIAFENVEEALRRLARACIAGLRATPASSWPPARLVLGLELRAPSNLEAPPDSRLARLLLEHWAQVVRQAPSYQREPALLCLLAWAVDWLAACQEGRWPPPWV